MKAELLRRPGGAAAKAVRMAIRPRLELSWRLRPIDQEWARSTSPKILSGASADFRGLAESIPPPTIGRLFPAGRQASSVFNEGHDGTLGSERGGGRILGITRNSSRKRLREVGSCSPTAAPSTGEGLARSPEASSPLLPPPPGRILFSANVGGRGGSDRRGKGNASARSIPSSI